MQNWKTGEWDESIFHSAYFCNDLSTVRHRSLCECMWESANKQINEIVWLEVNKSTKKQQCNDNKATPIWSSNKLMFIMPFWVPQFPITHQ